MHVQNRVKKIVESLSEKRICIAIAESCTGGYISHKITNIPGASKIFDKGVVSYSNQAKIDLLGVDKELIEQHGAVSEPVAKQMAKNIRTMSGMQIGISVTGIAGPGGGSENKPVGLVYMAFALENELFVEKKVFKTDRKGFKKLVLQHVVRTIETILDQNNLS